MTVRIGRHGEKLIPRLVTIGETYAFAEKHVNTEKNETSKRAKVVKSNHDNDHKMGIGNQRDKRPPRRRRYFERPPTRYLILSGTRLS